ncbi:hypothetical protein [Streptomyces sp. NPDC048636]|uniref:hypothetical protein n=1 Tax=Streptomyces sp. NPDC048636 TaxID=3155762 RepID=UPI00344058A9
MDLPQRMDPPPQVIELDGLTPRRFNGEEDLPELFRVIEESLEHLRPWVRWVAEHSMDRTASFLASRSERWADGRDFSYAIVLDGAIVGADRLFRLGTALTADAPSGRGPGRRRDTMRAGAGRGNGGVQQ